MTSGTVGGGTGGPDKATEALLHRFWVEIMAPAAEALRRRGVEFFGLHPDAGAASYYVAHQPAGSPFYEIEPATCEARLREMWQREGYAELAALAGPLMALAPKLAPRKEDEGDVSPFIYVMF